MTTSQPTATAHGSAPQVLPALRKIDYFIGKLAEIPAALLVAVEILILFIGVVARYFFHHPLVWVDELASILFLWLAMLGAVVALHRGEHMRMTAIVNKTGEHWRPMWNFVAVTACLAFLVMILFPAYEYVEEEMVIRTPALDIINAWRVAAILVGTVMMIIISLLRLVSFGNWKLTATGLAIVAVVAGLFHASVPFMQGLGNLNLLIFFVLIVGATILSGMPIAFSFGLATFGYLALSTTMPSLVVLSRMDEGMSQIILLAVPLFIFLGLLIEMTGMAQAMISFLASMLGHVRGGLAYVLVGAMYLVSGISGSKTADMAAIAPILFPEMKKRGAKQGELVALLSATGAQTETIPPSIVLITIGSVTGVSISALFTGGMLPGVVLAITLCVVVWARSRHEDLSHVQRTPLAQILRIGATAVPALALPFFIRFAVVEGIATATEVSTLGVAYAIVVGLLIYRRFDTRRLMPILIETAALSGAILMIIGTATAMAWALTQSGFSHSLATMMSTLPGGRAMFIAVSIAVFIVLGSVLEGIPAIVLFGPLLFPIAKQVGVHEVQYAMIVILSMGMGLFAPPFGVGYYGACAISKIHPDEGIRPIIGYMIALFIGIVVVAMVPWISIGFL
ncbi:TRAP transporter large permease subunit [Herbaspirillum lusitanum]|jgi:tripartite ATP-independent transporter DctM subunit|uniref:TRAP transporter large permease subunit n=1 Tax=Herbaspirillum lusitanum TaxID=213312 RepID=A0ABW9ACQ9_9BURK